MFSRIFITTHTWTTCQRYDTHWAYSGAESMDLKVWSYIVREAETYHQILLCGYILLPSNISSYHWQVIVDFAWFSSLTHLATLTTLRGYFQKRTTMAVCRAVFMGAIIVLLAIALGPTGWIKQFATSSTPAKCLFTSTASTIGLS